MSALIQIIVDHLGPPHRADYTGLWWRCPLDNCSDNNPSFHITPDQNHYYCFSCRARGDAIDYLRWRDNRLSFHEARRAVERIAAALPGAATKTISKAPRPTAAGWDLAAKKVVRDAARALQQPKGKNALAFLTERGLNRATIVAAKLGYIDERQYVDDMLIHGPSVVIPWYLGKRIVALDFRMLGGGLPKYRLAAGSRRGSLYPDAKRDPNRPVVVCEGEFDTLLVDQVAGDLVQAVTIGSASDKPTPEALAALATCPFLFLAHDADPAGDAAAARFRELVPHAIRTRPPTSAKDMSGIGGKLRAWIKAHCQSRHLNRKKGVSADD